MLFSGGGFICPRHCSSGCGNERRARNNFPRSALPQTVSGDAPAPDLKTELRAMKRPVLWLAYATTATTPAAYMGTFGYLGVWLLDVSRLPVESGRGSGLCNCTRRADARGGDEFICFSSRLDAGAAACRATDQLRLWAVVDWMGGRGDRRCRAGIGLPGCATQPRMSCELCAPYAISPSGPGGDWGVVLPPLFQLSMTECQPASQAVTLACHARMGSPEWAGILAAR